MGAHQAATALTTFEELLALRPDAAWPDVGCARVCPDEDPLRVPDVWREALILDVRCECVRMTVGVLLGLWTSIHGKEAVAALVVARGVRQFSWDLGDKEGEHGPLETLYGGFWWIGGSQLTADPTRSDRFRLEIACTTSTSLRVQAERFDYFVADVPNLPDMPDFGEGPDEVVRAGLPDWRKPCRPLLYSRRDPRRP